MPKHLLLGMTIRHMTGSAEIITILNRFGHCSSYSALLELETAMCKSVTERNTVLSPKIQQNGHRVIHLCWDNFDLCEEAPSGHGTTHSTHDIVIQETISDNANSSSVPFHTVDKITKQRSIIRTEDVIEPCFFKS